MGWWDGIWAREASSWIRHPLSDEQVVGDATRRDVQPNEEYLSVTLAAMRIVHVRRATKKFFGMVDAHVALPHLGGGPAEFRTVTTPTSLREVDPRNLDRVITLEHRLLGPVPYRGGDVSLEVGLFSIMASDLAGPYLDLLEKLGKQAGVAFVSAAMPIVPLISSGVSLLAGAHNDSSLEIGIAGAIPRPSTGYLAVLRASPDDVDPNSLEFHVKSGTLTRQDGGSVSAFPWMVLRFDASRERPDWFSIPEVSASYQVLLGHIRSGDIDQARISMELFRRTALTSPDLLPGDAARVVEIVGEQARSTLNTALTTTRANVEFPELRDISLY